MMTTEVHQEVKKLIKKLFLGCSIEEFTHIVNWRIISMDQNISEDFIREFQNEVYWPYVSIYQNISEDFMREFQNEVYWPYVSIYQNISEDFIREFKNKMNWYWLSASQTFSKKFIREFKDEIDINLYRRAHRVLTYQQKLKQAKAYAKLHGLRCNSKYLYAFRYHNSEGSGIHNKTICYEPGIYYRDWHLDMRPEVENSFGFGIFPGGNTLVKVKIRDWGVKVDHAMNKARVWGFQIVK